MGTYEILMAGFGGQGMLLSGKLLAHAAMHQGLEVSWLPSYGPEMRGGTANVLVCISDKPIGSPYVACPRVLLVMNQPSLEKFGPRVKKGGLIVIDSSLVTIRCDRDDCSVVYVAANDLAAEIGTGRAANMVMLGVYVGWSAIVPVSAIEKMIEEEFVNRPKFVTANRAAFQAGIEVGIRAKGVSP